MLIGKILRGLLIKKCCVCGMELQDPSERNVPLIPTDIPDSLAYNERWVINTDTNEKYCMECFYQKDKTSNNYGRGYE